MTKLKFLLELEKKLSALSQEDIEERLTFYSEIIEDRVEEGISEEDAVAPIGNIEEIAAQILAEHTAEPPPCSGEKVTVENMATAAAAELKWSAYAVQYMNDAVAFIPAEAWAIANP
jgi:uncharacterized membrane protein